MEHSTHIVCPRCDGVNRIPDDKNAKQAKCGKCKTPLFSAHPVLLNAGRFERHLERSDVPVLVDFWAPWCGPCRMMAPEFEKAAALLEPKARLVKVDTEENQALAARYSIRSIPTLMMFKNGREVARVSGAMNAGQLVSWARSHGL